MQQEGIHESLGSEGSAHQREREDAESSPYVRYGILTGLAGAVVVAVFFLIVDLFAGRPLATPSSLGATLFLGESFSLVDPVRVAPVAAYSLLHGAVFVAMSLLIAVGFLGSTRARRASARLWLSVAAIAFLLCEAAFAGFTLMVGPDVLRAIGFERVTLANALAAVCMGGAFSWLVAREPRPESVAREQS